MRFTDKYDWIDALRSGKYQQGRGRLRGLDGFCCLGVRCDLKDPNGWESYGSSFGRGWKFSDGKSVAVHYMPDSIRKGDGITPKQEKTLGELNDTFKSFDEIADWIQDNIPTTVD